MNIKEWMENEFSILEKNAPNHIMLPFKEKIIDLIASVMKGQSVGSALYYTNSLIRVIEYLAEYKPLSNLTLDDSEWQYGWTKDGINVYQNKRLSCVFKAGLNGAPFNNNAIRWHDIDENEYFYAYNDDLDSTLYMRDNDARTFTIDVKRVDVGEESRYVILDPIEYEKVFEYYYKPGEINEHEQLESGK